MVNSQSDNPNVSARTSAIDDPLHPYFLHHSDSPGLVLVSQLLTGDNYASWSRAMSIALSVKNKLGFIDGSLPKPSAADPVLLNSWIRNNHMVISWILNSVSKEISASIIFVDSAYEIWLDLKDRFQQSNGPRIFQLRRELMNLAQNHDSVSVYFTKLKSLWEELTNFRPNCTCGKCICGGVRELNSHYRMEYIMCFLMGLQDSFSQVRGQLLLMDPLPPINRVFSLIVQEERQRNVVATSSADHSQNLAFAANSGSNRPSGPSATGKGVRKDRPFCTHCNYHGHTIEKCYKLHGYPPGFRQRQRTPSSPSSSATVNHVSGPSYSAGQFSSEPPMLGALFQSLSPSQCQHLLTALSGHLASGSATTAQTDVPSTSSSTEPGSGHCIFHKAVENRCEEVFNLIYQMSDRKYFYSAVQDSNGNNLLHLGAKLAPTHKLNQVSGAALQMQREIQWYKEVERFVNPGSRSQPNKGGKTPDVIFSEEHMQLKKDGEKWMKDTANSCTISAALITTIMFAAAITVPGGNESSSGFPIFSKKGAFIVFAVADAVSLFTSTTSLLMFLAILTSRYAEEMFLYVLPKRLIIGLGTLFLSITSMMVAFCATLFLVFGRNEAWILIPVAALACLPVASFVIRQFPLLVDLIYSTYGPGIFGKKSNKPFY